MCRVALGQNIQPQENAAAQLMNAFAASKSNTTTTTKTATPARAAPTSVTIDDPEFNKYWKAPAAAAVAQLDASAAPAGGKKYRHEWFQSEKGVEVNVMAKKVPKDCVSVSMEPRRLFVVIRDGEGVEEYDLDVDLWGEIDPEASKYEVLGSKIEVRLVKKVAKEMWPTLEGKKKVESGSGAGGNGSSGGADADASNAAPVAVTGVDSGSTIATPYAGYVLLFYNSSLPAWMGFFFFFSPIASPPLHIHVHCRKNIDWNKVEQEVKKQEKEEELGGDAVCFLSFFLPFFLFNDE